MLIVAFDVDFMIGGIVSSLDENNLLVIPSGAIDAKTLIGKKARYVDKFGKVWPAIIADADELSVVVKFDKYPSGLGQGQIIDIMEDGDSEEAFWKGE